MSEGNRRDEIQGEIIHVYDGIEEADNELPLWWLFTFYGAIIFAVGYWYYYEGFAVGPSSMQAYAGELAAAAAAGGEVTDELLDAMAQDDAAIAAGRETFAGQCAVCHREDAGGNIGPNLTDRYWLHGGSPVDIHRTIQDGVPTASMPPWGAVLGPVAVQQVTAYVISLRNTDVDGKAPQGELWSPGAAAAPEEGAEGAEAASGAEAAGGAEGTPEAASAEADEAAPANGESAHDADDAVAGDVGAAAAAPAPAEADPVHEPAPRPEE